MQPININITEGQITGVSGSNHLLILDPESREVYNATLVGPGLPHSVFHSRALAIGIGDGASGEHLQDALRANLSLIDELFSLYRGHEWDGNNHSGSWEDWGQCSDILDRLDEIAAGVPTYYDAGLYLDGDTFSVVDNALLCDSIEEAAAGEVRAAVPDAILDHEDVERAITWLLERELDRLEDLEPDDFDYDPGRVSKIRELLKGAA